MICLLYKLYHRKLKMLLFAKNHIFLYGMNQKSKWHVSYIKRKIWLFFLPMVTIKSDIYNQKLTSNSSQRVKNENGTITNNNEATVDLDRTQIRSNEEEETRKEIFDSDTARFRSTFSTGINRRAPNGRNNEIHEVILCSVELSFGTLLVAFVPRC